MSSKQKFKRKLSLHVTSRWYRAPEIILLTKKYDTKVDMWAIGCTIAELCHLVKQEKSPFSLFGQGKRKPCNALFTGSSCFPLSPMKSNKTSEEYEVDQNNDQLRVIFDMIGKHKREDLEGAIKNPKTLKYCEEIQQTVTTKESKIKKKFSFVSSELQELIDNMLKFKIKDRWSARRCLCSPIFDKIRNKKLEMPCDTHVHIPCLLYTSPSPRDVEESRMPSSA